MGFISCHIMLLAIDRGWTHTHARTCTHKHKCIPSHFKKLGAHRPSGTRTDDMASEMQVTLIKMPTVSNVFTLLYVKPVFPTDLHWH